VCGSQERHRAIWPFLLEHTALLREPLRVLHVAPEPCFERRLRRHPRVDLVTADLTREDVDVRTDLQKLLFDDAAFDLLLCNHVLEHVPDDRAAMGEMFRVLRPGGAAVVTVPGPDVSLGFPPELARTVEAPAGCGPDERRRLFGHPGHLRQYGLDLSRRLRAAGFEARRVEYGRHLQRAECEHRRVYPWYPIQLCLKPR
jgi:SAM-dependent methyltransferase